MFNQMKLVCKIPKHCNVFFFSFATKNMINILIINRVKYFLKSEV